MTPRHALAALWTALTLAGCLLPGSAIRDLAIFGPDKLYHLAAFVGFALLWRWAGASARTVLASGLAFALLIEVLQGTLPIGRFADPYDTVADAIGLGLGLLTARVAERARDEREQRTGA